MGSALLQSTRDEPRRRETAEKLLQVIPHTNSNKFTHYSFHLDVTWSEGRCHYGRSMSDHTLWTSVEGNQHPSSPFSTNQSQPRSVNLHAEIYSAASPIGYQAAINDAMLMSATHPSSATCSIASNTTTQVYLASQIKSTPSVTFKTYIFWWRFAHQPSPSQILYASLHVQLWIHCKHLDNVGLSRKSLVINNETYFLQRMAL